MPNKTTNPALAVAGTEEDDEDLDEFVDDYAMLTGNSDQYSLSEQMVHHCGGAILPVHWIACKAVLAFYAGSSISKMKTTTKAQKETDCLELYYNAIEALDEDHFDKDARDFFCNSFQKKNEPMPAHSLYRYYHDTRAKVRNQVLPYFPRSLVTMKSGKGFHDSCNDVYIKAYREEMAVAKHRNGDLKYTPEEVADLLPPLHWEFTKSPWYFGLLVKIFRRDPQLALHVADVMNDSTSNKPTSRAALRRQKQESSRQRATATAVVNEPSSSSGGDACSVLTSSDTSAHTTRSKERNEEKQLWAKVMASKAYAENINIAKRMGKMEELEKGMSLLERMKPVIGDDKFASKVCSVFAALPDFESFDDAVNVVDLVETETEEEGTKMTTRRKRQLSPDAVVRPTMKSNKKNQDASADDVSSNDDDHKMKNRGENSEQEDSDSDQDDNK